MFQSKLRRGIGLGLVLVFMVSTLVSAEPKPKEPSPETPPPGSYFTTEEQEAKEQEAFWKRINAEENRRKAAKPGEATALWFEGDLRIVGPYFTRGSGAILDDTKSGIASSIWPLFLRVLNFTNWKTAGTVISNVNSIYRVVVDTNKDATSQSYHSYSYYNKDGDYYKGGSWCTGARIGRRVTYASGWSMYYDTTGYPRSAFEPQGWQYVTEQAGCHWNDHAWILGMAQVVYDSGIPMITEAYDECNTWNP